MNINRTNRTVLFIFLAINMPVFLSAQIWPKIYGDNFSVSFRGLEETYDHGYLIAGNIEISDYIWLIKTDVNGNIIWDKRIGSPSDFSSYVDKLELTNDYGFIMAGFTKKYSLDGEEDPSFFKFNSCGELQWCRTLISPGYNGASGIIQLDDGSYIGMLKYFGGDITTVRISLVKMDHYGEPLWIKHFCQEDPGIYNEEGWYLYLTNSGEYLISGRCYYPGNQPFWILSDTNGVQSWDLMGGHSGQAHQVVEVDTGTFYSTSFYSANGRPISPTLFKFNSQGTLIDKYFMTPDTIEKGSCASISQFNDTTLAVGYCWSHDWQPSVGKAEIALTDTMGSIIKQKRLLDIYEVPREVLKTYDEKILVGGMFATESDWDIYMWKLNSDLEFDTLYTASITYDSLCPYPIVSDTTDYDCDLFVNIEDLPTQEEYEQTLKIFPNPASEYVVFDLSEKKFGNTATLLIYNSLGTKVGEMVPPFESQHITLNIQDYVPGPYIAIVRNERKVICKGKFVVVDN